MKAELIEGVRQYPIRLWLDGLLRLGIISKNEYLSVLADDAGKFEKLLYISQTLQINVQKFASIPGTEFSRDKVFQKVISWGTQLYDVRMTPDPSSSYNAFRKHGLRLDEIVHYVKTRIRSPKTYMVYISAHTKPVFSGTIISDRGNLIIELVKGQHLHLTQPGSNIIYQGYWQKYKMSFNCCDSFIRRLIWNAAKMIIVLGKHDIYISPLNPPTFFGGYFEFVYNDYNEFILTDYSSTSFFSNLQKNNS